MRAFLTLIVLVAAGCRSTPMRPPADCPPPPTTASRVDSATIARLAPGRFDLTTVNTARGYGGEISRGVLTLARLRADSEMVVRQSIHGPRNVWRPLTGRYETTARGQTYWRVAEVLTGGLSIGCVDCMDASPTWYSIVAVTPDGFVGRWVDYQSGIAIAVDGHGRRLPNPEGFYCARRVESSARATKRIDSSHPKLR